MIQESDVEEFEMEPDTFVRNDLEESDQESRRRNCMILINQLVKKFPQESQAVLNQILELFNKEYTENRNSAWQKKAGVINLILASQIQQHSLNYGVNQFSITSEQVQNYISQLIEPELDEADVNNLQIVKSASLKFLFYFRELLPQQRVMDLMPKVARQLQSDS